MLYFIKRFVGSVTNPSELAFLLAIAGLALAAIPRTRRWGWRVLSVDAVLVLVVGFGLTNGLLSRLENRYPPFPVEDAARCESFRGATVVVLGQGLGSPELPVRFRENDCFRARLAEGAVIAHKIPECHLVVSQGGGNSLEEKLAAGAAFRDAFGFSSNQVSVMTIGRDTSSEAAAAVAIAGTNRIVLVTSASHMPRAMIIFRAQGADPFPAPCDYRSSPEGSGWGHGHIPFTPQNFLAAERLVHESLGLAFESLRGK